MINTRENWSDLNVVMISQSFSTARFLDEN